VSHFEDLAKLHLGKLGQHVVVKRLLLACCHQLSTNAIVLFVMQNEHQQLRLAIRHNLKSLFEANAQHFLFLQETSALVQFLELILFALDFLSFSVRFVVGLVSN
jgi:hypothetical protein